MAAEDRAREDLAEAEASAADIAREASVTDLICIADRYFTEADLGFTEDAITEADACRDLWEL